MKKDCVLVDARCQHPPIATEAATITSWYMVICLLFSYPFNIIGLDYFNLLHNDTPRAVW